MFALKCRQSRLRQLLRINTSCNGSSNAQWGKLSRHAVSIPKRREFSSGTSRVLRSVASYANRSNWKPGMEPGIDPKEPIDTSRQDLLHSNSEITVVDFTVDKITTQHLDNDTLPEWIEQQKTADSWPKCRWINVNGLSWDVIQALGNYKNLHRLAIEDLVHRETRTKADWYSDHVYIALTLQKLVRRDQDSDDADGSNGSLNSKDRLTRQGHVQPFLRRLFGYENPVSDAQTAGQKNDGFVVTHGERSGHSYTQKLQTLQRYRRASDVERIAFMESRSALTQRNLAVCAEQVSIFLLSDNTVISFFETSAADIEIPILSRLNTPDTILRRSCEASMLTQAIIDTIIDLAIPVVTAYQDVIGELEMKVLKAPNLQHAKDLYIITSEISAMRNFITPIASLVTSLQDQRSGRPSNPILKDQRLSSDIKISAVTQTYLRDVEDHCVLILQTFDQLQHSAQGMIDLIFNTISAYQNNSMKQLTAATIMFLPLTFITGYFGMNLTEFPSLEHNEWFFWKIAGPIAAGTAILLGRQKFWGFFLRARQYRTTPQKSRQTSRKD